MARRITNATKHELIKTRIRRAWKRIDRNGRGTAAAIGMEASASKRGERWGVLDAVLFELTEEALGA